MYDHIVAAVDGLAMATHGPGGVQRLLLGRVRDKVLGRLEQPPLLVRPGEAE